MWYFYLLSYAYAVLFFTVITVVVFVYSKHAFSCMKFVRRSPGVVQVYQGACCLFVHAIAVHFKLQCGPMPNVMEYGWRPLFNAAKFGWRPLLGSNAAKTSNPLKCAGVPQTRQPISAASGPKCTILWRHVEEILLFNKFFSDKQIRNGILVKHSTH